MYNADVTSVYFTTVAFLPLLQAGTETHGHLSASVIVISSMSGIMRHAQGHFSYNAAKGGTVHLAKLMSAEFQKVRVRVNSIAPGYFPSEMTAKQSGPDQKSHLPAENIQAKGHVPAQRPGSDEEMAQAVVSVSSCHVVGCFSPVASAGARMSKRVAGEAVMATSSSATATRLPRGIIGSLRWQLVGGADQPATFDVRVAADDISSQLFLTKNAYVNGEILAVDGGVLNVVSGR